MVIAHSNCLYLYMYMYMHAGDLADGSGTVPKAIIHWNYKTISRGEESLYARLTQVDGSK